MQKHHQKIALFSILAVALGSSLSWNPENTQIARHYIDSRETGEAILAQTADVAPANGVKPEKQQSAPAPAKEVVKIKDEAEEHKESLRAAELIELGRLRAREEMRKEAEADRAKQQKDEEKEEKVAKKKKKKRVKAKEIELSDECSEIQDGFADESAGSYLECVKEQMARETQDCASVNEQGEKPSREERRACLVGVANFYNQHLKSELAGALSNASSPEFSDALGILDELAGSINSKGPLGAVRKNLASLAVRSVVTNAKTQMDVNVRAGYSPALALKSYRQTVLCELNAGDGCLFGIGTAMKNAFFESNFTDPATYNQYFVKALEPFTLNNGPIELNGKMNAAIGLESISTTDKTPSVAPAAVTPGARGQLPQFQGTFKPVPSTSGTTSPQWVGQQPQRPMGAPGTTPTFSGGTIPGGQAPYPTARPNLP